MSSTLEVIKHFRLTTEEEMRTKWLHLLCIVSCSCIFA